MKTKFYSMHAQAIDSDGNRHIITVVGKFVQKRIKERVETPTSVFLDNGKEMRGKTIFNKKGIERKLIVGVSICHPSDEFNEEYGIKLAKRRIENGEDAGTLTTNNVTMLTKDLIQVILFGKLSYIKDNIEKFISK